MSFYSSQPNPSQHGTQTCTFSVPSSVPKQNGFHVSDFAKAIETNVLNSKSYNGTPQGQYFDPDYDFLDPAQDNSGFQLAESHPSRSFTGKSNVVGGLQVQLGHPGQSLALSTRDGGAVQYTGGSEPRYDSGRRPAGVPTSDSTDPGPMLPRPYQSPLFPKRHGTNTSKGSRSESHQ